MIAHTFTLALFAGVTLAQVTPAVDDETRPTCDGPTPIYLKWPHTYSYHLQPNEDTQTLLAQTWPLFDDVSFREEWSPQVVEGSSVIKWIHRAVVDGDLSVPPTGSYSRHGWKHTPDDLPQMTDGMKMKFLQDGVAYQKGMELLEEALDVHGLHVAKDSASHIHQDSFTYAKAPASKVSKAGYIMEVASKQMATLIDKTSIPDMQLIKENRICQQFGQSPITCEPTSPYRTFDGTCNNLKKTAWGKSHGAFRRLFLHQYEDGLATPRTKGKAKSPLPNARHLSLHLKSFPRVMNSCFSILQMSFGQFLDHDLTSTPTAKGVNGTTITCCADEVLQDPGKRHPECFPIFVDFDDPFYSAYGTTCLEFIRSMPAGPCHFGPREQQNQVTSYIDGSALYGSTLEDAKSLRTLTDGLLKTSVTKEGHELLPIEENEEDGCNKQEQMQQGHFCFRSGDERVNEHILLTLLTTLFAREHNRIARELRKVWPGWDDERLFQETRRIVVAEIQHITYNEFLSGLLGPLVVQGLDLNVLKGQEYYTGYDNKVNAGISNELAAAALRMGHSMIPEHFFLRNDGGDYSVSDINQVIFQPFPMYARDGMKHVIHGALSQSISQVDQAFSNQIIGQLFNMGLTHGLDLVAFNIQRGRDHGLAGYVEARRGCGFPPIKTFDDLKGVFDPAVEEMLPKLYKDVEDIDLFVGGVAEKTLPGALVGPTFACILGDQFLRLRKGDRFWYENKDQFGSFTPRQLASLHQVSLARVLCDNFPEIRTIQRWALQLTGAQNPVLSCDSLCIPNLDLTLWHP